MEIGIGRVIEVPGGGASMLFCLETFMLSNGAPSTNVVLSFCADDED